MIIAQSKVCKKCKENLDISMFYKVDGYYRNICKICIMKKRYKCIKMENRELKEKIPKHIYLRIYRIWSGLKSRCLHEKDKSYKHYGGRGIKVCDEWINNPRSFIKWAVENGYKDNLTIERKNNDDNYCPENCTWATSIEQSKNKRNSVNIEYMGKRIFLRDFAIEYNFDYKVLYMRIIRSKYCPKCAISFPVSKNNHLMRGKTCDNPNCKLYKKPD